MSSSQQMKEFADIGKEFGLKGAELQAFVMEQVKAAQDVARDERAAERERREEEKAQRDAEKVQREAELEFLAKKCELEVLAMSKKAEAEREAELAALSRRQEAERNEVSLLREKLELEGKAVAEKVEIESKAVAEKLELERRAASEKAEIERRAATEKIELEAGATEKRLGLEHQTSTRKLEMQLELETLKLRRQEAAAKDSDTSGDDEEEQEVVQKTSRAPRPKMPCFNESKDDMDAYLQRFERFAELCKWEGSDWALHLSALLSGRALEVYARLPADKAKDFKKLKIALLRRYDLTLDGFRRKFYEARRESDEGGLEYLSRTSRYLTRWIQLAEVDETFQDLKELLIKKQFLSTCEAGLSVHIRDKGKLTLEEVGKAADRYLETRRNLKASKPDNANKDREKTRGHSEKAPNNQQLGNRVPSKCYVCSKPGHLAKDCRHRFQSSFTGRSLPTKTIAANACVRGEQIVTDGFCRRGGRQAKLDGATGVLERSTGESDERYGLHRRCREEEPNPCQSIYGQRTEIQDVGRYSGHSTHG